MKHRLKRVSIDIAPELLDLWRSEFPSQNFSVHREAARAIRRDTENLTFARIIREFRALPPDNTMTEQERNEAQIRANLTYLAERGITYDCLEG